MPFDPEPLHARRFDPKLVEQAEAPLTDSGDLLLPDDLLELAAQLGDDAQYLAKLYPCGHLPCGHHAPRDESITADGSSTRPTAFPLAEREGHNAAPPAAFHTHIRRTSRRLLRAVALVASLAAFAASATWWYPRGENDPQPRNIASSPERSANEIAHVTSNYEVTLEPVSLPPARQLACTRAPAARLARNLPPRILRPRTRRDL
jgi:hypothetical protein